ncbi:MAG: NYN domain-containing protein [Proteobacteria bacterium]|nr:NYN domain-containing protein [Pseudomonadota bacterium]MBU1741055.1 NYN domain-containing protein [Pseudomonadota bacterium]
MKLIIDGYNLIRRSPSLGPAFDADPETARRELIGLLALYRKKRGHTVTVVFDAAASVHLGAESSQEAGVRLVYTAQGQTADEAIVRRTARLGTGAVVVTSDRELARSCERAGAEVMSSAEFEAHVYASLTDAVEPPEDDDEPRTRHDTRKKGPAKRAKKRDRQRRRKLQKL